MRLHHIDWIEQVQWLLDGTVDVSFVLEPVTHDDIVVETVFRSPRVAAVAGDHPLAEREQVAIEDLAPYPVAYPAGASPEWAAFWTASPRPIDRGVADPGVPVATSDESMSVILSGGVVIAMATAATLYQSFDIRFVPIVELEPASIGVAWLRRTDSAHVLDFVAAAREVAVAHPSAA